MKRLLIPVLMMCLVACQPNPDNNATAEALLAQMEGPGERPTVAPPSTIRKEDTLYVTGDFNGDHRLDTAYSFILNEPPEDSLMKDFTCFVRFTSGSLPDPPPTGGRVRLVNEGDLNGDGADELSYFHELTPDCMLYFSTETFRNGEWETYIGFTGAITPCKTLTDEDLQQRILLENGELFVMKENWINGHYTLLKYPLEHN